MTVRRVSKCARKILFHQPLSQLLFYDGPTFPSQPRGKHFWDIFSFLIISGISTQVISFKAMSSQDGNVAHECLSLCVSLSEGTEERV